MSSSPVIKLGRRHFLAGVGGFTLAIPFLGSLEREARAGDGVSPIIVASNDLAAAWAGDEFGEPLYPLNPGGPRQREMALRGGINIVMYTLTGNYKADQVHVPELLERLSR